MSELLPCPFCGGKFKMSQEPHDNGYVAGKYYIYHECGPVASDARECIIDIHRHFDSEAEAISAWNTRIASVSPRDAVREGLSGTPMPTIEDCHKLAAQIGVRFVPYTLPAHNGTKDQEIAELRAALADAHRQALEEAAKVADDYERELYGRSGEGTAARIAAALRALASGEPTASP